MNRYTNISLSEFNPMTLQEKMIVPSIKRKQHDSISADQTAILDKLGKVQPHDKYFNEAQLLKKQITDKISEHATKLAKEGVNNNMLSDTIALNREYNDLASETGKLGMINRHNLNVAQTKENYLKQAKEMGQSPEAAKYWVDQAMQNHMNAPLYDEKGRVADFSVDQGPVKYVDREAKFHEFAKSVDGLSGASWDDVRSNFKTDTKTGAMYVAESGSKGHSKNNYAALQKVADYMNSQLLDKNSDLYKSEMYNRRNIQDSINANQLQSTIYRKYDNDSGSSSKISSVNYPDKTAATEVDPNGTPYGTPSNLPGDVVVLGGGKVNTSEIGNVGKSNNTIEHTGHGNIAVRFTNDGNVKNKPFTVNNIKDPVQRNLYEATFSKLKRPEGYTFTNKDGKTMTYKLKPSENKNSSGVANLVSKIISAQPDMTFQRNIVSTGSTMNNFGLMPNQSSKAIGEVSRKTVSDLKGGKRQFIDPSNPDKAIKWNDLEGIGNVATIQYDGYASPIRLKGGKAKTSSELMPHKVTVTYKDNTSKVMYVTRIKGEDDRGINFNRMNELDENVTKAVVEASVNNNDFLPINSKSKGFEGLEFRYIKPQPGETQGSYELKTRSGKIIPATEPELISMFNSVKD